jgi:hypothetical protein
MTISDQHVLLSLLKYHTYKKKNGNFVICLNKIIFSLSFDLILWVAAHIMMATSGYFNVIVINIEHIRKILF